MRRKQLQQLSKPELIEIILRQQALIEQLQARVAELEEQIKRLTEPPQPVQIVFGAVDEACTIWVSGRRVPEPRYPYQGDNDSWQKAFQVDVTDVVHFEGPNVLAVRVEDNAGAGASGSRFGWCSQRLKLRTSETLYARANRRSLGTVRCGAH